jgi:hypothetical protein
MRNLFQMSSGLRFSGFDSPRAEWEQGRPDHALMYSEANYCFEVLNPPPPPSFLVQHDAFAKTGLGRT